MSYQELWCSMTKRERIAVKLMCLMKTDESGYWAICLRNRILSKITSMILCENVFDWEVRLGQLLGMGPDEMFELKTEMAKLKTAFN